MFADAELFLSVVILKCLLKIGPQNPLYHKEDFKLNVQEHIVWRWLGAQFWGRKDFLNHVEDEVYSQVISIPI